MNLTLQIHKINQKPLRNYIILRRLLVLLSWAACLGSGSLLAQNLLEDYHYWVPPGQTIDGTHQTYRNFNRSSPCDDCSEEIKLPFTFQFYHQDYSTIYLNSNGNISFEDEWNEYTPSPFCESGPRMIAPFYADVDLGQCGQLSYLLQEHYVVFTWESVCHYVGESPATDLLNTFQLILTDGTVQEILDMPLPDETSIVFNYLDMQWTTGNSSEGINGFVGQAAIVGLNAGDGQHCFNYGHFDHEGTDHQTRLSSGVSHLDHRSISLNGLDGTLTQNWSEKDKEPINPSLTAARVFPNPFSQELHLEYEANGNGQAQLQLVDMANRILFAQSLHFQAGTNHFSLPVQHIPAGMYFLSFWWENEASHFYLTK